MEDANNLPDIRRWEKQNVLLYKIQTRNGKRKAQDVLQNVTVRRFAFCRAVNSNYGMKEGAGQMGKICPVKGDIMAKGGLPELLNYKQKGKDMNEFIKVPMSEKLAYCFGDPALTLMYTMTTTLLIYFYTNVVGISAGAVGMIMLLSRVFDGFSDVLMGTIIDRTHSKYGKARIWILRLAIPYALAAVLLFTMPPMGDMGKIIYAFVTYNIMNTVVYTAISQPFHALGSLMSRDRRERTLSVTSVWCFLLRQV